MARNGLSQYSRGYCSDVSHYRNAGQPGLAVVSLATATTTAKKKEEEGVDVDEPKKKGEVVEVDGDGPGSRGLRLSAEFRRHRVNG